jgi:hypothetical protein
VAKDPSDCLSPLTSAKSYFSESRYSARYFPANIPWPMTYLAKTHITKHNNQSIWPNQRFPDPGLSYRRKVRGNILREPLNYGCPTPWHTCQYPYLVHQGQISMTLWSVTKLPIGSALQKILFPIHRRGRIENMWDKQHYRISLSPRVFWRNHQK